MKYSYIWNGAGRALGDRHGWLKFLAIVLIGLAAGPEIGLAMEMTALLEILGTAGFFLSFHVGAKMLFMDLARAIHNFVVPPVVYAMSLPGRLVCAAARASWLGVLAFVAGSYGVELCSGGL